MAWVIAHRLLRLWMRRLWVGRVSRLWDPEIDSLWLCRRIGRMWLLSREIINLRLRLIHHLRRGLLKDDYLRLRLLLVDLLRRLDDQRRVLPRSNVLPATDTAGTASGLTLKFAHLAPV